MACAAVDRQVKGRKSRHRKARWPAKLKAMRETCAEREAETRAETQKQISDMRMQRELTTAKNIELKRRLQDLYLNGPAVVEIVQVKQSWFGARFLWAFLFFLTNKLRFERIVKGR